MKKNELRIKAIDIESKEVINTTCVVVDKDYIKQEIIQNNDIGFNIQCQEIENLLKVGVVNKLLVQRELEFMKNRNFYNKLQAFIVCFAVMNWLSTKCSFKEAIADAIAHVLDKKLCTWQSNCWNELNMCDKYILNFVDDCINNSYRTIVKIVAQKGKCREYMTLNNDNLAQIWEDIEPSSKIFCSEWSEMRLLPYLGEKEVGEQDLEFCYSDFYHYDLDYDKEFIEL